MSMQVSETFADLIRKHTMNAAIWLYGSIHCMFVTLPQVEMFVFRVLLRRHMCC